MRAYRLSGGLFRRREMLADGQPGRGTDSGYWGAAEKTIGGLAWGRSAGAGKGGHRPANVVPAKGGGPGPEVFVDWRRVLELSGEPVAPETPMASAEGKRYRHRIARLEKAGYFVPSTGRSAAPAGDTVEIVRRVPGSRHGPGGILIRASARYCEAYVRGKNPDSGCALTARSVASRHLKSILK